MPEGIILDKQQPVVRVPLRKTPHKIAYHKETGTYAVLLSESVVYHPPLPKATDEVPNPEPLEELGEDQIRPVEERFEIRLMSPLQWTMLDSYGLKPDEFKQSEQVAIHNVLCLTFQI